MVAKRTTAQRLGRVLERVTRQSGRLPETPAYGSWLLGLVAIGLIVFAVFSLAEARYRRI